MRKDVRKYKGGIQKKPIDEYGNGGEEERDEEQGD